MDATRDRILDAVEDLLAEHDGEPPIDAVARVAGVSKGGLLYHFPTKRSLIEGVVRRGIARTTAELEAARHSGSAGRRWLELSRSGQDVRLATSLASTLRLGLWRSGELSTIVAQAYEAWRAILTEEVGDATLADLTLLVGDGLLLNALVGVPSEPERLDRLHRRLLGSGER